MVAQLVPVLCLSVLAKKFGGFQYSLTNLLSLEKNFPSRADFEEILDKVSSNMFGGKVNRSSYRRVAEPFLRDFASKFGISYTPNVGKWEPISVNTTAKTITHDGQPSAELIEKVDRLLPQQPWPRNIDQVVTKALKVRRSLVSEAINMLISQGRRKIQRDGIIYDEMGRAVAVDVSRTDLSVDEINQILAGTIKSEIPIMEYNGIRVLQLIDRSNRVSPL